MLWAVFYRYGRPGMPTPGLRTLAEFLQMPPSTQGDCDACGVFAVLVRPAAGVVLFRGAASDMVASGMEAESAKAANAIKLPLPFARGMSGRWPITLLPRSADMVV